MNATDSSVSGFIITMPEDKDISKPSVEYIAKANLTFSNKSSVSLLYSHNIDGTSTVESNIELCSYVPKNPYSISKAIKEKLIKLRMSPPGSASSAASIPPESTATAGTGVAGVPVSAAVANNKSIIKLLQERNKKYKADIINLRKKARAEPNRRTQVRYAYEIRVKNNQIDINNRYIEQLNTQIKYIQDMNKAATTSAGAGAVAGAGGAGADDDGAGGRLSPEEKQIQDKIKKNTNYIKYLNGLAEKKTENANKMAFLQALLTPNPPYCMSFLNNGNIYILLHNINTLNNILTEKNDKDVKKLRQKIKDRVNDLDRNNDVKIEAINKINGIKNLDKLQLLERMIEMIYPALPSILD